MARDWTVGFAGVLFLFVASQLWAETHDVAVMSDSFNPGVVNIKPGDTVRWTLLPRNGTHDVTADDLSWASPQSTSFVYERTFNALGDVPYHCTLHSSPGKSPATGMNGIVRVQEDGPAFQINVALSDAWYFPDWAGQGFFITVWEEAELVFLSWFTYDTAQPPAGAAAVVGDAGHRWLTAQGPYAGDTAALTVYESAGGLFSQAQPQPATQAVGTIDITWSGCNAALLSYDLPGAGMAGDIPLERIVLDHVPVCETLGTP